MFLPLHKCFLSPTIYLHVLSLFICLAVGLFLSLYFSFQSLLLSVLSLSLYVTSTFLCLFVCFISVSLYFCDISLHIFTCVCIFPSCHPFPLSVCLLLSFFPETCEGFFPPLFVCLQSTRFKKQTLI